MDDHTAEDHVRKLKHDCKLAQKLAEGEEYCDWTIICTFYFAVHCIEAYAHKKRLERFLKYNSHGRGNQNLHQLRQRFVDEYLPKYFTLYIRLYDKSRASRYDPKYFERIVQMKGYHKRLLEAALKFEDITK